MKRKRLSIFASLLYFVNRNNKPTKIRKYFRNIVAQNWLYQNILIMKANILKTKIFFKKIDLAFSIE